VTDLERSHAELRAALLLAGKEIRKLNFGRADGPVLVILRRVLREARRVACNEVFTTRMRHFTSPETDSIFASLQAMANRVSVSSKWTFAIPRQLRCEMIFWVEQGQTGLYVTRRPGAKIAFTSRPGT
jgi:hypothetical protein